jgi:O-antigen ligase
MTETPTPRADLEPSLLFHRTYATRRRITRVDAALLLSLMVILIDLIPFNFILPGTTDVARPGLVVGFFLFAWWVLARFAPHLSMTGPQPLRWAVLIFMMSALLSYAVGFTRGLTSMEANGADRRMLFFCILSGAILGAADGVPNWLRLRSVVSAMVWCGGIVASIGVIQYMTGLDITQYLIFPGLQSKGWAPGFLMRGSSYRVASTTAHFIELSAMLAVCLPLAIHAARFAVGRARRTLAMVSALIIATGIAATLSRTGIIAVVLMMLCLVPVWGWRMRYNMGFVTLSLLAVMAVASPGMIRTFFNLFNDAGSDSSVSARTEDYPVVFHYVGLSPWLGRGTGTWIPPQYRILDNQWLVTLLDTGIVGVVVMLSLHMTGIVLAYKALRRSTIEEDKHLCAALISTQVIAIAVAATFDSLSFSTYATMMAVSLGMCGAVWRLTHPARQVRTSGIRWYLGGSNRVVAASRLRAISASAAPATDTPATDPAIVGSDAAGVGS